MCDEESVRRGSVAKTPEIPCPFPLEEGSEEGSVQIQTEEEKGEGQWQAWGPEKGRVDNGHPVEMAP